MEECAPGAGGREGVVGMRGKDVLKAGGEGGLCPPEPTRSLELRMPELLSAGDGSLRR